MKHAVMIMGYGDGKIVQSTINILDDPEIDFFIHWDKKFKIPEFNSSYSHIYLTEKRRKVYWGNTQTIVERMMMEEVYNTHSYDYVHLISSNDMPLMTPDYFKRFFERKPYAIGFLDYIDKQIYNRAKYFYPIRYMNLKSGVKFFLVIKNLEYLNKILGINRLKNKHLEKGCNWFSMHIKYVERVLNFKDFNMFKNTFTGDEFFVQTVLKDLKPKELSKNYDYYSDDYRMTKSSAMACRYIDWLNGHGKPYVFSMDDVDKLKNVVNTEYAFGRKLDDYKVISKVFESYQELEGK